MKVLVTGATGFTGHNLAKKLFKSGHDVKVLVRNRAKVNVTDEYDPEIIEGNIIDSEAVEKAVKGCEKVFHIAAMFRTAGFTDKAYYDVHVKGTENLLQSSLRHQVQRFVHCSTVGVHGDIDNPPANELSPFKPGDIYQQTKLEGELKTYEFYKKTKLPISIIRPTAIYGPGDLRLLKLFKLATKSVTLILGDGEIFYHMVYIDDLVDAFILASEKDTAIGEAFIAGGDELYSLNRLIEVIAKEAAVSQTVFHLPALPLQLIGSLCEKVCIPFKIEPPIYRRRVDFFTKSRAFDISKAKRLLGYQPRVTIQQGIANTYKWYKEQNHL